MDRQGRSLLHQAGVYFEKVPFGRAAAALEYSKGRHKLRPEEKIIYDMEYIGTAQSSWTLYAS